METKVRVKLGRFAFEDGAAIVSGDVVVQRDGNEVVVCRPECIPTVSLSAEQRKSATSVYMMAIDYCGPWRINGVSGCFATLADAAQQAELLFNRDDPFARPIVVYDKWGQVAYVPTRAKE